MEGEGRDVSMRASGKVLLSTFARSVREYVWYHVRLIILSCSFE